ncbi:unnamed protein product [Spirodela intermedia]|uniref:Uncharacterized protein n=1 Tax=Spirodela intermedia TaxID=51605 RepID=A0ABN7E8Z2_SPIIN|nr:unnamed protein product [Spirodela intermedia]
MGSIAQYLKFDLSRHPGLMESLLERFKLYLDHQSLMNRDDAVYLRLKFGGDDS